MSARVDLELTEGADWSVTYTALAAFTATGAVMHIRREWGTDLLSWLHSDDSDADGTITVDGGAGTVELYMSADKTLEILSWPTFPFLRPKGDKRERLYYDLNLLNGSAVTRLLEGRIFLDRAVTRADI